ncbi:MAG: type II toxin-antitoxin system prevent-host-death family antitoxin [Acidobacteria bacterium]|nr:MAG: type II toxin-antitoxin system prevent-host-death family antitoxin [Acidobacteriota bacterium]
MKRASISEAKNNLSALIDGLRSGNGVLITDRGRPVARLEPVRAGDLSEDEALAALVRDGLVTPRKHAPSETWLREPPIKVAGVDLTAALLEERREGR